MKKHFTRLTALLCLVSVLVFTTACQQTAAGGLPDNKTIESTKRSTETPQRMLRLR